MTGERELPEGEILETGGKEEGSCPDWVRSGGALGVTKPTWRTLGSIRVRRGRRGSMESVFGG